MSVQQIADNFLNEVSHFRNVDLKPSEKNTKRINVYVSPESRKRWMQVDINPTYLAVSMDHMEGELSLMDVSKIGISQDRSSRKTSFKVTPNTEKFSAVHFSFFETDNYDFSNEEFIVFLEKHYKAFLKRVRLT
ncbi:hypothetical protein [Salisediminibacterium selenitireducens]|uniref:Uncharacterized protein n=1 Tax=Bacillus selenitireducens (strain ATCC 700615 / DSM 15326 / MLS10) TaxID=439292 RepID=D6XVX9_BACIE|nr:hypothetical protein [Salisediminibacterium selenitireducens]ADH97752.1 hypothetical protein Bsel_0205 [[Bacillus] selenitireducens MLS10]